MFLLRCLELRILDSSVTHRLYVLEFNISSMAAVYKRFCRITSRIKGDHVYRSHPKINSVFDCEVQSENIYSGHAILVSKKLQKEKVVVGHVPDGLKNCLHYWKIKLL